MNFKRSLAIIFGCMIIAQGAFSQIADRALVESCSKIDLKAQKIGTSCVTSTGAEFRRVEVNGEQGIQDLSQNGKVWFNAVYTEVSQYRATDICNREAFQVLPSKSDFALAEGHGLREAFFGDMNKKWFWSSSVARIDSHYAEGFNGSRGHFDGYDRSVNVYPVSARCISISRGMY